MENSKRIRKVLKKLDKIQEDLEFYTNGTGEYKKDFQEIRELVNELGLDKKEDRARLAKKLKDLWSRETSEEI
jgi:hypothetical protein